MHYTIKVIIFTGIKLCELCEFWSISRKLVSPKIIQKLPIREINSFQDLGFLNWGNQVSNFVNIFFNLI